MRGAAAVLQTPVTVHPPEFLGRSVRDRPLIVREVVRVGQHIPFASPRDRRVRGTAGAHRAGQGPGADRR
ncbi:hypothetical protein KCH_54210 [Kitasatospora cheerisanensis KCTC 2395]|uniref:Uncharacterized protein n=1 Tax=Kitasatospora cheerisanensis KCTC 2395 TaxID=1348663 RepID=A0A066YNN8_9ACTN|nr:hypothetical protein KCH_54210 [Kitasatospora cheerisanensis KCTC 2395]